ncbi:YbjQ family protein [Litorimonas sp. RW-G-Af-16]|uniref:YbjQ family protein n=1 Tax=Litorimonas sp. RW-G-Af-16 TaxID=3241168 RepID=UPI00390C985E
MFDILVFITLISLGIIFGSLNERRHHAALRNAEAELAHIALYNLKSVPVSHAKNLEAGGVMVTGNVVIAIDYFKRIAATLRMIVGGRLKSYESLVDRARREAIIRMKREADAMGATAIYNARIEFSVIGQQPRISGAELVAYGTAVKGTHPISSAV